MSILHMSISAGVLVIAIVLVRAVALNRLPKRMFLVLWGVALFRLLVPVSIPMRFSIYDAIGRIAKKVFLNSTIPPVIKSVSFADVTGMAGITTTQITEAAQSQVFSVAPATIVWIAGMIAALIVFAVILFKSRRDLRFITPISGNDFLNEWLSEHRLLRPITIMQSDRIRTPFAVGIVEPRIVLPKSMDINDKQLLNYVLTHEYYHIKRFDALYKMLLVLALCVHWFNPMVWIMFVLANRDLELTCDEMVIYRFGAETRTAYAYTLIGLAEQRSKFAPLYNGFSRNATEERITSIMKIKKSSILAIVIAVLIVAGATTVFAAMATPERDIDSEVPDGYKSEVLTGTENIPNNRPYEVDSVPEVLAAVNRSDENRYSPEEWATILEKVAKGEILFFETHEEEVEYFQAKSHIPIESPEVAGGMTSEWAEILALETRDEIQTRYPEIDTKILDVIFSRQPNGAIWRLLSVRHDDEGTFSEDDWTAILKAIELGLVQWED